MEHFHVQDVVLSNKDILQAGQIILDDHLTLEILDLNFTCAHNLLPAENTVPVKRGEQEL